MCAENEIVVIVLVVSVTVTVARGEDTTDADDDVEAVKSIGADLAAATAKDPQRSNSSSCCQSRMGKESRECNTNTTKMRDTVADCPLMVVVVVVLPETAAEEEEAEEEQKRNTTPTPTPRHLTATAAAAAADERALHGAQ